MPTGGPYSRGRGRYRVDSEGKLVPMLKSPEEMDRTYRPASLEPIGPTRIGEYLLVDLRLAWRVDPDSKLYAICAELESRGHCNVVESTVVIDILEATNEDRPVLLDKTNWPKPEEANREQADA